METRVQSHSDQLPVFIDNSIDKRQAFGVTVYLQMLTTYSGGSGGEMDDMFNKINKDWGLLIAWRKGEDLVYAKLSI